MTLVLAYSNWLYGSDALGDVHGRLGPNIPAPDYVLDLIQVMSVPGPGEQEAGEGGKVGDTVMGEAEVVDLVDVIEEKPAEPPAGAAKP